MVIFHCYVSSPEGNSLPGFGNQQIPRMDLRPRQFDRRDDDRLTSADFSYPLLWKVYKYCIVDFIIFHPCSSIFIHVHHISLAHRSVLSTFPWINPLAEVKLTQNNPCPPRVNDHQRGTKMAASVSGMVWSWEKVKSNRSIQPSKMWSHPWHAKNRKLRQTVEGGLGEVFLRHVLLSSLDLGLPPFKSRIKPGTVQSLWALGGSGRSAHRNAKPDLSASSSMAGRMSRMKAEVTLDTQDPAKTPEDSLKGSKGLGSFGRLGAICLVASKLVQEKKNSGSIWWGKAHRSWSR